MARCCGGPSLVEAVELAEAAALSAEESAAEAEELFNTLPGVELGYAERITDYTTTSTSGAAGIVPGLSLDLVGTGRPIDIEIVLPSVRHSVASTAVITALGTPTTADTGAQLCVVSSPSTTVGRTVTVRRRLLLALGEELTVGCVIYGTAAGTSTLTANALVVSYISAVSR